MKINIKFIFLSLIIIFISYLIHQTALLTPIILKKESFPELPIAFITFTGPYQDSYKYVEKVEVFLKNLYGKDFTKEPCFGIYYENPNFFDSALNKFNVVGKILPSNFQLDYNIKGEIRFGIIEEIQEAIVVDYPLRSIFSIIAGMIRVYPKFKNYFEQNGSQKNAAIELYKYRGNNITFLIGISELKGLAHIPPILN